MKHEHKKGQACPATNKPTSTNHACKCNPCRCRTQAAQMIFDGFPPPPEREDGPLVDYLEARPGWWGRSHLCGCLSIDERTLRLQAEHSHGRVIFSSTVGGLKATRHADETEIRACAAELRNRAASHTNRADEIERAGGLCQ